MVTFKQEEANNQRKTIAESKYEIYFINATSRKENRAGVRGCGVGGGVVGGDYKNKQETKVRGQAWEFHSEAPTGCSKPEPQPDCRYRPVL